MNLRRYKSAFQYRFRNIKGWRTNRKIIVIESDDWGSIRMPSRETYHSLLSAGIRVDKCPYNTNDSLESEEDLSNLFAILSKFSDRKGKHPLFTANYVTSNPDFQKIKESGFEKYYYELFTETYKKYPNHNNSFKIIQQGIHENLFFPQFHGREHLNVNRWMSALQKKQPETRLAFEHGLFGLSIASTNEVKRNYMAALDFEDFGELADHIEILEQGLEIFKKIFGFKSETFIAPNYIWHRSLEKTLHKNGVKYIQGSLNQLEPLGGGQSPIYLPRKLGRRNEFGQISLTRNAFFEPSLNYVSNPVDRCLTDIKNAFDWRKPAIIVSHRINYIGGIMAKNRNSNLEFLSILIDKIINAWPDVEFMNSTQLGNLIDSDGI